MKRKYASIALGILVIASLALSGFSAGESSDLQWEYKVAHMSFWAEPHETVTEGMALIEKNLNRLGRDGWELVAIQHEVLILKRQMTP